MKKLTKAELEAMRPPPVDGLPSLTLEGIAEYVKSGKAKRVIILQGAGLSCAAGIPDFRTPGTGLYSQLQKYKLPFPEAIFTLEYFDKRPEAFFMLNKELMPGTVKPTIAHYLPRLFIDHGLLTRVFTQNIDGLERQAGIPADKIVEAHGTFYTTHCRKCRASYTLDELRKEYETGQVVKCKKEGCDGVLKPDIVFFGENLPERYWECSENDFDDCDLLIVIGTSLEVHPFASLIHNPGSKVPRVLFNMNKVATYKEKLGLVDGKLEDFRSGCGLFKFDHLTNTRDVFVGGDCQKSILKFIELLGWEDELRKMVPPETQEKINEIQREEANEKKTEKAKESDAEPETEPETDK